MPLEAAEHQYREDRTYPDDDRPENVARNVGIKRPNEPSETALTPRTRLLMRQIDCTQRFQLL